MRIPGPHPHGYVPIEGLGLVDYTAMNPSVMGASGEMISTTADLDRFFGALLGGRLLPAGLLRAMKTPGGTREYGLGLAWWQHTTCGVEVYGNDGDALAYQTWSYTTEDRRRQATIAVTPDFTGDVGAAVDTFLDRVFCGP
ncbi:serine hydrolase family protein [Actinoplanes sp. RD1]|uniref:serine hydrolase n=1 Tax=Actinoplanes sp. RD1 TaxID=3064538 RepID=UPI002740EE6D|nr:serine hydrolase [Actinoplanes sp. RD1]